MIEVRDNLAEILSKLKKPFDPPPAKLQRRRLISKAGGKRRPFAPTVRGRDIMTGERLYDSSSIDMGESLSSPTELIEREEREEMIKFLQGVDKSKFPEKDGGIFTI